VSQRSASNLGFLMCSGFSAGVRIGAFPRGLQLLLAAAGAALLVSQPLAAQCGYDVEIIGNPACVQQGALHARAMNDAGVIVGNGLPCNSITGKAFRWSPENGFSFLNLGPGLSATRAESVAEDGTIAGVAWTGGTGTPARGFVWKDGAVQFILPDPVDPGSSVSVEGIFDDGTVIGYIAGGDVLPDRAFAWKDGEFLSLGKLDGTHSRFLGASGNGFATGWISIPDTQLFDGQRWTSGSQAVSMISLPAPYVRGQGWAVSSHGHVAGRCELPDPKKGLGPVTLSRDLLGRREDAHH